LALSTTQLQDLYRFMLTARRIEETLAKLPGFHPAVGEEAIPIGTFFGLSKQDYMVPHYRGALSAAYMRGADLRTLFAGVLGKATGHNFGRFRGDICMPIEHRIIGMFNGILGSTIGLATGTALSAKVLQTGAVTVISFGDGCSNLGAFHENINLAASLDLPIVYVCQNNQYAMSTPSSRSIRAASVADRAVGYGIPGVQVDGNDVIAVHSVVDAAVQRARSGLGPTLIEALTYRVSGHYGGEQPAYQSANERNSWCERDPIRHLETTLRSRNQLASAQSLTDDSLIQRIVADAMSQAQTDPEPGAGDLGEDTVFATSAAPVT